MKTIGTQLKELRKRKSLTLRYVCGRLRLKMGELSDIEHNRIKPSNELIKTFCHLYGWDWNKIINKSELSAFQKEVGEWANQTFYTEPIPHWKFVKGRISHLKKEVDELISAPYMETPEELADCFLLLLHLAYLRDIDLLEEARKKMEVNRKRKWGEMDKSGVVEHV